MRRSIFLCFFFRMRLRRFLIREPIRLATLAAAEVGATRETSDTGRPADGTAGAWQAKTSEIR